MKLDLCHVSKGLQLHVLQSSTVIKDWL